MCRPASFILTKDQVLWSKRGDSHEMILRENGIRDTYICPDFARVEVVPPYRLLNTGLRYGVYDFLAPPERWVYALDQKYLPDWYDESLDEARTRAALEDWIRWHIIKDDCQYLDRYATAVYSNIEEAYQCTIRQLHGSLERADQCQIGTMVDNARVSVLDRSRVLIMVGTSRVKICDESSDIDAMYDKSTVGLLHISKVGIMCDTAYIKRVENSEIGHMHSCSSVDSIVGTSTVKAMHDESSIRSIEDHTRVLDICNTAYIGNARNRSYVEICYRGTKRKRRYVTRMHDYSVLSCDRLGPGIAPKMLYSDAAMILVQNRREKPVVITKGNPG